MNVKPRRAWVAGLLAILTPGLGHLYGGRPALAVLVGIGPVVFGASGLVLLAFFPRWAVPVVIAIVLSFALVWSWQLVSACVLARRQGTSYRMAWYNRGLIYALFAIVLSFFWVPPLALIRQRLIEPFKIPSESMTPTLMPGDYLFVIKSVPAATVTRGDVVVFRDPGRSGIEPLGSVTKQVLHVAMGLGEPQPTGKAWVGRIIGIGGDTVEIRDHQVLVNGQPYVQGSCEPAASSTDAECVVEKSPSGKSYSVLYRRALNGQRRSFEPVRVEPRHYYLLGDNRDDSVDSRYRGQVSEDRIAGRAVVIWLSYSEADFIRWANGTATLIAAERR